MCRAGVLRFMLHVSTSVSRDTEVYAACRGMCRVGVQRFMLCVGRRGWDQDLFYLSNMKLPMGDLCWCVLFCCLVSFILPTYTYMQTHTCRHTHTHTYTHNPPTNPLMSLAFSTGARNWTSRTPTSSSTPTWRRRSRGLGRSSTCCLVGITGTPWLPCR